MYQPSHAQFIERRIERLHRLIREYPLGTLITQRDHGIEVNHVPFLLDSSRTEILTAHVPRANPVWQELNGRTVVIVFHGPDAYISPSWYPSKQSHGKAVPTWNYATVHTHGIVRTIQDRTWLRAHLELLTTEHEQHIAHPWKIADAPGEYIEKLLGSIVGLEISMTKLEGKFKLGQNRPKEDQVGVVAGLAAMKSPLATFAREHAD